jgi:hypothetical protein
MPLMWSTSVHPSRILNTSLLPSLESVLTISRVRRQILAAHAGETNATVPNIAQRTFGFIGASPELARSRIIRASLAGCNAVRDSEAKRPCGTRTALVRRPATFQQRAYLWVKIDQWAKRKSATPVRFGDYWFAAWISARSCAALSRDASLFAAAWSA